ncbi:hypothetical protein [Streptomyces mirabilis]|uniref:hypothetical protein n=1 Tax=Streptomyces mirabilis TaxID=68239 RepID=UPI00369336E4
MVEAVGGQVDDAGDGQVARGAGPGRRVQGVIFCSGGPGDNPNKLTTITSSSELSKLQLVESR